MERITESPPERPESRVVDVPLSQCSLARAIEEIGDAWTLLILRQVICGVTRFDQMQQDLGISRAVLSDRLQKAVEFGLLEKMDHREPGQRVRHRYEMTDKGRGLLPALLALRQWADDFVRDEPSRTVFCDQEMSPIVVRMMNEQGQDVAAEHVIAATLEEVERIE